MGMVTEESSMALRKTTDCSRKELIDLCGWISDRQSAMSFYYSSKGNSDCSHAQEAKTLKDLLSGASHGMIGSHNNACVVQELDIVRDLEAEMVVHPRKFRALFVSDHPPLRLCVTLPYSTDIASLRFGRHFSVVPLIRALEACETYTVVVLENGKARGFVVRGEEIEECRRLTAQSDISLHPEDERVGWPHHVNASAEERIQHFFRHLGEQIREYMCDLGVQKLVVGCRNGIWKKMQAELTRLKVDQVGRFSLKRFDALPSEIIADARASWLGMKEHEYQSFWQFVADDPAHSAVGMESVLDHLEGSNLRTLYLGAAPDRELLECANCGRLKTESGTACESCKSESFYSNPACEALLRRALALGAEILAPAHPECNPERPIAARLRY